MSTYSKRIKQRPQTASTNNRYQQSDLSSTLSSQQIDNQRSCQWTNKVHTQMKNQTRYQLDYRTKPHPLKDLPQIKMSLYDDPKFKDFLQNNFVSMSQKDYRGPPSDFVPQQLCRPVENKTNQMASDPKTTYSSTFQGYKISNPDRFNKPMPNNISLHNTKINGMTHYQHQFKSIKEPQNKSKINIKKNQKTSPFADSLPLYNQTEHRSQFVNYTSSRVTPSLQIDNLTSNLSYKGQYVSDYKKQFIKKEKRHKLKTAQGPRDKQ